MSGELCENCQLAGKCEAVRNAATIARIARKRNWPPQLRVKTFSAITELYPDCLQKGMVERLGQIMPPPRT